MPIRVRSNSLAALTIVMLLCTACGSASVNPAQPSAAPNAADTAALQSSVGRLADAWNAGDGNRWASEFATDGSLINILGVVFPNQSAVAGVTNAILSGPFKGSTFTPSIRRVRFLGNDVAIVSADISVTNYQFLPPGAVPTQPGLLLTRLTLVYQRLSGSWKVIAAQNTAVLPSQAASPSRP